MGLAGAGSTVNRSCIAGARSSLRRSRAGRRRGLARAPPWRRWSWSGSAVDCHYTSCINCSIDRGRMRSVLAYNDK